MIKKTERSKENILYIGYYSDDKIVYDILSKKINNMSIARQNFEKKLLTSFIEKDSQIDIVSYVPTDGKYVVPEFSVLNGKKILHFPIKKNSFKSIISAYKAFNKYLDSFSSEKINNLKVIMYDVNLVFLFPLLKRKRKYNIEITTICAELSVFRRTDSFLKKQLFKLYGFFQKKFDKYVLFAETMAEILKCHNKPYVVIEGIAPDLFGTPSYDKKNIVMYAGGLAHDNNIVNLIESCKKVDDLDELWFVGEEQTGIC